MADESGLPDAPERRDAAAPRPPETASLRRTPKYTRFLILGAALGIIVALVLTFAFRDADPSVETGFVYSLGQVFGFVALICIPVGAALGGVVALVLDRVVGRRTREVVIDRERIRPPD